VLAIFVMAGAVAGYRVKAVVAAAPQQSEPTIRHVAAPSPLPAAFALSPDGTQAVTWAGSPTGILTLQLHPVDGANKQMISGSETPEGATPGYMFWSPDGRTIGFFSNGHLMKIDRMGGTAQEIGDARSGHGGTWDRLDVIVFAPTANGPLYSVSPSGGTPTQVTQLDSSRGEVSHRLPWFLPDGIHFLYLALSSRPENSGIWVGSTDSKERIFLMRTSLPAIFSPPDHLLFMGGSTLMAQSFDPWRFMLTGSPFPVARSIRVNQETHAVGFSASDMGLLAYRNDGAAMINVEPVKEIALPIGIDPRADATDSSPR
jgi:eukaryotic-like serine/threonine-protein kinase